MLKHYFSAVLRQFRRQKFTAVLNIACLTFGLTCFLGVYVLIAYLQGADRHIANADRIYVLTHQAFTPGSGAKVAMPAISAGVAPLLKVDFPQIETVARLTMADAISVGDSLKAGTIGMDAKVRFADASIISLLRLPLLSGSVDALKPPKSIVLSDDAALRLFGGARQAMGREVIFLGSTPLTVTGVLDAIPQPSHLSTHALANPFERFDVLVSMDVADNRMPAARKESVWSRIYTTTYVVLPEDGSLTAERLRAELPDFVKRHPPSSEQQAPQQQAELGLLPLSGITLTYFEVVLGMMKTNIGGITLLYMLGGMVLLIACLNYANLATAQAAPRAKEIGLQRIVGATRFQIAVQYLFEAALATTIATVVALLLLTVLLFSIPAFDQTLNVASFFLHNVLPSWQLWLTLLGILAAVTVVSGSYPAFVLSSVRPLQAVRIGHEKSSRRRIAALIVGAQFTSASFLVIAILVMRMQSNYVRDASFTADADPIVVLTNRSDTPVNIDTLRTELLKQPHIKNVTATGVPPWEILNLGGLAGISATADPQATRRPAQRSINAEDFFATLEFKLLAGRLLSKEQASDNVNLTSKSAGDLTNVVVDLAFVTERGWHPQDAVGKILYYWWHRNGQEVARPVFIVGVVDSKPLSVMQLGTGSNIYFLDPTAAHSIIVRIAKNDVRAGLKEIDDAWNRIAPNVASQRKFGDQILDRSMWTIDTVSGIFNLSTLIAIVIAVLGLSGISIHAIHRRMHEIGVRKTLGANSKNIFAMLIRDFSRPVAIANLLSWPLAYVLMRAYLSVFTHSTGLSFVPFVGSLGLALLIAWITISAQAARAARLNPATILRYE